MNKPIESWGNWFYEKGMDKPLRNTLWKDSRDWINIKELTVIFAPADTNPCVPAYNLSTIYKHYETCTNLCSTAGNTLEARYDLSTASNLQKQTLLVWLHCPMVLLQCNTSLGWLSAKPASSKFETCGTSSNLNSNLIHPFRP